MWKGVASVPSEPPELVSVFSFMEREKYKSKIYQEPVSDVRLMRFLEYQPSHVVLWKSYFGRYVPQIRPTPEMTEGLYSMPHAYLSVIEDSKAKAKALYRNYLAILEARDQSS